MNRIAFILRSHAGKIALFLSFEAAKAFCATVAFYGIGQLPGGALNSQVRDAEATATGIMAVGSAQQNPASALGDTAVIWTTTGGLQPLASLNNVSSATNGRYVVASQIANGNGVIASRISTDSTGRNVLPALYNTDGPLNVILGLPAGLVWGAANAASTNGKTVYGFAVDTSGYQQGFVWTLTSGAIQLPPIPGYVSIVPTGHGCTNDGTIDVGAAITATGGLDGPGTIPFEYSTTSGMTVLPLPAGGTWGGATGIEPNGTYIVGCGDTPANPLGEILLWTNGVVSTLGVPIAETATGMANNFGGVTHDGAVVVAGGSLSSYVHNNYGWFDLQAALTDGGANLSGWSVLSVLGISADGTLIFGSGTHNGGPEGFVAQFPSGYLAKYGKPAKS